MKKKVATLEICCDWTNAELDQYLKDVLGSDEEDGLELTQVMVMEIQPPPPE